MNEEIAKSAKDTLSINLISSDDISTLKVALREIQNKNYDKCLQGFKPDLEQSIAFIANFIEDAFNHYDEIVVFACDAISYEYYLSDIQSVSKNYSHKVGVLSSVFPSTTSVVWPSIITGAFPSEHGIYGTSFLHEEFDKNYIWISNTLNHKGDRKLIDDRSLRLNLSDKKTLFERLKNKGIISYYLGSHGQGEFNPFRHEITKGSTNIKPDESLYLELKKDPKKLVNYFLSKDEELLRTNDGKKLIWNYIDFDDFIHEHGYVQLSKHLVWDILFKFWNKNRMNRLFLFISDHGQTFQNPSEFNVLKASSSNSDLKYDSGGAGRVVFFYPENDKEEKVFEWVKNIVGENGLVLKKNDLIAHGLVEKNAAGFDRIGSVVAIATSPLFPSVGNEYVAEHGSLSSEEMFVPFIIQLPSNDHE